MSNVVPFERPKSSKNSKSPFEQHKGKTLCRSGFHKWKIKTDKKFDVKQGKLVTVFECERCGEVKVEAR